MRRNVAPSVISPWVGKREAADHLGICERTLDRWAATGLIPAGRKMGANGVLRWRLADIDAWMQREGE
jgi:predicted DNA-binding transcriptional regulator AlpA